MEMKEKATSVGEHEIVEEEDEEDVVLPGFRFHPSDEELVGFYLRRKVNKKGFSIEIFKEIDIYKYDPWDLPKVITAGEKEWYFFCLRGRKYRNSIRPNRVTGSGFWKATGIDRPIYSTSNITTPGDCIGLKKSLVYYRGSAGKGTKTDWMMHEFRLPSSNSSNNSSNSSSSTAENNTSPTIQEAEIWTICRILKRNMSYKKYPQSIWKQPSTNKPNIPEESSSKASSFESDSRNEYRSSSFATSSAAEIPHAAREISFFNTDDYNNSNSNYNYYEDDYNVAGQFWNSAAAVPPPPPPPPPHHHHHHQVAITTTVLQQTNVVVEEPSQPNTDEFSQDTNWDELGSFMEFMTDQTINAYYI